MGGHELPPQPTIPVVGILASLVLLGAVVAEVLVAGVVIWRKVSGREGVGAGITIASCMSPHPKWLNCPSPDSVSAESEIMTPRCAGKSGSGPGWQVGRASAWIRAVFLEPVRWVRWDRGVWQGGCWEVEAEEQAEKLQGRGRVWRPGEAQVSLYQTGQSYGHF